MARMQRQTKYNAMIETGNESQPSANCCCSVCYCGRLHGSVVPAKFLLVLFNMLSAEYETYNALVSIRCERTEHDAYHES